MMGGFMDWVAGFFGKKRPKVDLEGVWGEQELAQAYEEGCGLISAHMILDGRPGTRRNLAKAVEDVKRGIALLERVVAERPENWAALWVIGKGYQVLDRRPEACEAFGESYRIQQNNPDVAREYMFECLNLGMVEKAVPVAERAVEINPKDAGLFANLGLAYLIAGRLEDAEVQIERALAMSPGDGITLNLKGVVQQVKAGKRAQPKRMADLRGRG